MNAALDNAILHQVALVPMASHEQESHNAPHVNCLHLKTALMLLMMLLTLCDAGANDVMWLKETCCISFQLSLPKEN